MIYIEVSADKYKALIEACRAAKSFIDDDAEPYPRPGGYTLAQMKQALNAVLPAREPPPAGTPTVPALMTRRRQMNYAYELTGEQKDWLCHARLHGFSFIASGIEENWKRGRRGQVDGRTPMPGLKRELNRINRAVSNQGK